MKVNYIFFFSIIFFFSCSEKSRSQVESEVIPAANNIENYIDLLSDKSIGLIVNQTSQINGTHLVDTLASLGVNITKVFAPEHGFRGKEDAGATINNEIDSKSGLPIISLYGKKKKPSKEDMNGLHLLVFDIQDVGVRFYTYISTLHYVMEACAEYDLPLMILDRPNPNGHYIDGPVLQDTLKSFVGMHPVPIVYGMTIGEYGQMINGEKWLENGIQCKLKVIKCQGYHHDIPYDLPIKPSPNLPNYRSILLYPSLCLFEGTNVSVGRGTDRQFQIIGHPDLTQYDYHFVPKSMEGAKYPKHQNIVCFGRDLSTLAVDSLRTAEKIDLSYLITMHKALGKDFFVKNNFFDKLAGTYQLRKQLNAGSRDLEIRNTWKNDIEKFKTIRVKYLLYD